MKKIVLLACALSAFAAGSFAQTSPAATGAKLVAERDAAYAKAHPSSNVVKTHAVKKVMHTKHTAKPVAAPKDMAPVPAK